MGQPRVAERRAVRAIRLTETELGLVRAAAARVPIAPGVWMRQVVVDRARAELAAKGAARRRQVPAAMGAVSVSG